MLRFFFVHQGNKEREDSQKERNSRKQEPRIYSDSKHNTHHIRGLSGIEDKKYIQEYLKADLPFKGYEFQYERLSYFFNYFYYSSSSIRVFFFYRGRSGSSSKRPQAKNGAINQIMEFKPYINQLERSRYLENEN